MINGPLKVLKSRWYFERVFARMKQLVATQCYVRDIGRVQAATELQHLRSEADGDFCVTERIACLQPDFSSAADVQAEVTLEGMGITLMELEPPLCLLAVGTPSTPERWARYDAILTAIWRKILVALQRLPQGAAGASALDQAQFHELVLVWYYYLTNMGPLSHASPLAALACVHALCLAADMPIAATSPTGIVLEWEAWLCVSPSQFVRTMQGHHFPQCTSRQDLDELPLVEAVLPTFRTAFEILHQCVE